MASFLGKTITTAEASRIRAAHLGKVAGPAVGVEPTLVEVENYYWQKADNEVVEHEQVITAATPIGVKDK